MAHLFYSKHLTRSERLDLIDSKIVAWESKIQILTVLREELRVQHIDQYQAFCLNLGIKQKQLVINELKNNIVVDKKYTNKAHDS